MMSFFCSSGNHISCVWKILGSMMIKTACHLWSPFYSDSLISAISHRLKIRSAALSVKINGVVTFSFFVQYSEEKDIEQCVGDLLSAPRSPDIKGQGLWMCIGNPLIMVRYKVPLILQYPHTNWRLSFSPDLKYIIFRRHPPIFIPLRPMTRSRSWSNHRGDQPPWQYGSTPFVELDHLMTDD